jgi:hypothetical protein
VFINRMITPDDTFPLPKADLVLLLSIWHHWVRAFGFDNATLMLRRAWQHCNAAMVFETGESEMPSSYGLPPMRPDAKTWLSNYLNQITGETRITHLGNFKAFGPGGGEENRVVYRNLFLVARTRPQA